MKYNEACMFVIRSCMFLFYFSVQDAIGNGVATSNARTGLSIDSIVIWYRPQYENKQKEKYVNTNPSNQSKVMDPHFTLGIFLQKTYYNLKTMNGLKKSC